MLTLITPDKHGTLFGQLMQEMGQLSVALDELPEVVSEAQEGSDFLDGGQHRPILDRLYLCRVSPDAILSNQMAQKESFMLKECTFA